MPNSLPLEHQLSSNPVDGEMLELVELAVIVPTFNEKENIYPFLTGLRAALAGYGWEVVFVDDDSHDGTASYVRDIAQHDPQVRVIRRIGRRGLTSACVEGVLSTSAPFFAVLDADMQHDERLLPLMLCHLKTNDLDVVIGSRYVEGSSIGPWGGLRRLISRLAVRAAQFVLRADLHDPMSGFFVMRRRVFDDTVYRLSQHGFKFLLDLFASAPRPLRFAELPYHFRLRTLGESKLDSMAMWEYGMLICDKLFGQIIPPRFVLFGVMGSFGVFIHLSTLATALSLKVSFAASQSMAVIVAMTSNYILNNLITYRDKRLHGWQFVYGLLSFYLICSIGAAANIGIAAYIYSERPVWWLAGLGGALIGAVWNFAMTSYFTWRARI